MGKLLTLLLATTAAFVVTAVALAAADAGKYSYKATMSAAQEVPKPAGAKAGAGGVFTATATEHAKNSTLAWKLTFSKLSGPASAAHIHLGAKGKAGNVLVPLCAAPAKPCMSGMTGKLTVKKDIADALERGKTYVNVHTAKNPAGEIRGQVKLVGES
jgi:CHRD domain-containing protein